MKYIIIAMLTLSGIYFPAFAAGAVAFSEEDDAVAIGFVVNADTPSEAEADALRECEKIEGKNCEIVHTFENICIAIAFGEISDGTPIGAYATEDDEQDAKNSAIKTCEQNGGKCTHHSSGCDVGDFVMREQFKDPAASVDIDNKCINEGDEHCFKETSNIVGCFVFSTGNYYHSVGIVTWSGKCENGVGVGHGTENWDDGDNQVEYTGQLVDGKFQGKVTVKYSNDNIYEEGNYVDGNRQGKWTLKFADGGISEGNYVNGKESGKWTLKFADGSISEGNYVNGKESGKWMLKDSSGDIYEGNRVDGKAQGKWTKTSPDGSIDEINYVDGVIQD